MSDQSPHCKEVVGVKPLTPVPPEWRAAVQEFVNRVEKGEICSVRTYAKFKALLEKYPCVK